MGEFANVLFHISIKTIKSSYLVPIYTPHCIEIGRELSPGIPRCCLSVLGQLNDGHLLQLHPVAPNLHLVSFQAAFHHFIDCVGAKYSLTVPQQVSHRSVVSL